MLAPGIDKYMGHGGTLLATYISEGTDLVNNQQQGSLQTTNLPTDFAIQGDGFFIVNDGQAEHYTRDSNFIVDGFLVGVSLLLWSIAGRIGVPAAPS